MKYIYLIVFAVSSFLFLSTAPTWVIFGIAAVFSYVYFIEETEENNATTTNNKGERGKSSTDS